MRTWRLCEPAQRVYLHAEGGLELEVLEQYMRGWGGGAQKRLQEVEKRDAGVKDDGAAGDRKAVRSKTWKSPLSDDKIFNCCMGGQPYCNYIHFC